MSDLVLDASFDDPAECLSDCIYTTKAISALKLWDDLSPSADDLKDFDSFVKLNPYAIEEQETEEEPWSETLEKWHLAELGSVDVESAQVLDLVKYRIRASSKFESLIKQLTVQETKDRNSKLNNPRSDVYLNEFFQLVRQVAEIRRRNMTNVSLPKRRWTIPTLKVRRIRSGSSQGSKSDLKSEIEKEMQDCFSKIDELYIKLDAVTRQAGSCPRS